MAPRISCIIELNSNVDYRIGTSLSQLVTFYLETPKMVARRGSPGKINFHGTCCPVPRVLSES